jgi:glycerol-3-phosphate dehydrogenase (NAD(P)+)
MSLMKGVEVGTAKRMSEVIEDVTGIGSERVRRTDGAEPVP